MERPGTESLRTERECIVHTSIEVTLRRGVSLLPRTPGLWERLTEVGYETEARAVAEELSNFGEKTRRDARKADPR